MFKVLFFKEKEEIFNEGFWEMDCIHAGGCTKLTDANISCDAGVVIIRN